MRHAGTSTPQAATRPQRREIGLELIVAYKLVKAVLEVVAGSALLVLAGRVTRGLAHWALLIHEHATAAWSSALSAQLARAATSRDVSVVALACLFDGVVSAFEAWALHRRFWWSAWLVAIATACLLPFEVVTLVHRATAGRVVLLAINAAIVAYLVRRTFRGEILQKDRKITKMR